MGVATYFGASRSISNRIESQTSSFARYEYILKAKLQKLCTAIGRKEANKLYFILNIKIHAW